MDPWPGKRDAAVLLAPGAPCPPTGRPSLSHSHTFFTGCCCRGDDGWCGRRCGRSWGHLRASLPGHVCPEPVGDSSEGPQIRRRAPACPSEAPPTGLGVDAQRQPLLPGRPCGAGAHLTAPWATLDQAPTGAPPTPDAVPLLCDLPRNPCGTPQAVAP